MKLANLVQRRFEVLVGACFLGLAFVGVVWVLLVLLKAINPVVFHFNLLLDIVPWFTPVLLTLVLLGPLYWKVAGLLTPPGGGLQRLAQSRYQLVVGAFFYLLCYTLAIWAAMNLLRIWDVQDFHFNLLVDWIPAILPPWLGWVIAAPLLWKMLAALDDRTAHRHWIAPDRSLAAAFVVFGAALLTGGGLLLNEGVYAGVYGQSATVAQDMTVFGVVVFAGGALTWGALLLYLWRAWRPGSELPARATPLDRFRAARGRILTQGLVLTNLTLGVVGLLMAALQAIDPHDFHFYMALDIWSVGLPLVFGWALFASACYAIPARLARLDPAHYGAGAGSSEGPSGPATPELGWGYSEGRLTGSSQRI